MGKFATYTVSLTVESTHLPSGDTRERKPIVRCPSGLPGNEFQVITSSRSIRICAAIGAIA